MSSEEEAGKELRKMVAFIMQEAGEKSREIQVKADEEFNIEKAKLVHQETVAIEQQFERKIKQTEIRRKILQSNQVNKARLRVLQAQDECIEAILEEARDRLGASPPPAYESILTELILQSFYRFMDGNTEDLSISLQVRQEDYQLALQCCQEAKRAFQEATGAPLKAVKIEEQAWLESASFGGVIATAMNGRIRLENTLASRLGLASEALLPVIRTELFGPSQTRRFFD